MAGVTRWRVTEIECGDTWRNIRDELDRMHLVAMAPSKAGSPSEASSPGPALHPPGAEDRRADPLPRLDALGVAPDHTLA
ncbi:MAG: hypothetical protein M0008_13560 [Actinomycetota bacterium]|nr:hypothetical protein [Actinomycetota bacterium]